MRKNSKQLPLLATVAALAALSASIAYWLMVLNPPPTRPLASAPVAVLAPPSVDAAATLFGGQAATAVVSNYVLTGVIASGRQGVAIIVADGGQPMALKIGRELAPGVTLDEVQPRYVTLRDNGITKRIELAADTHGATPLSGNTAPPMMGQPVSSNATQAAPEPPMSPGALQQQPNLMTGQQGQLNQAGQQQGPSPSNPGAMAQPQPQPSNPGAVAQPSNVPLPPAQLQIPPPTRSFAMPSTSQ